MLFHNTYDPPFRDGPPPSYFSFNSQEESRLPLPPPLQTVHDPVLPVKREGTSESDGLRGCDVGTISWRWVSVGGGGRRTGERSGGRRTRITGQRSVDLPGLRSPFGVLSWTLSPVT